MRPFALELADAVIAAEVPGKGLGKVHPATAAASIVAAVER